MLVQLTLESEKATQAGSRMVIRSKLIVIFNRWSSSGRIQCPITV
jgi:hypothetical protein